MVQLGVLRVKPQPAEGSSPGAGSPPAAASGGTQPAAAVAGPLPSPAAAAAPAADAAPAARGDSAAAEGQPAAEAGAPSGGEAAPDSAPLLGTHTGAAPEPISVPVAAPLGDLPAPTPLASDRVETAADAAEMAPMDVDADGSAALTGPVDTSPAGAGIKAVVGMDAAGGIEVADGVDGEVAAQEGDGDGDGGEAAALQAGRATTRSSARFGEPRGPLDQQDHVMHRALLTLTLNRMKCPEVIVNPRKGPRRCFQNWGRRSFWRISLTQPQSRTLVRVGAPGGLRLRGCQASVEAHVSAADPMPQR